MPGDFSVGFPIADGLNRLSVVATKGEHIPSQVFMGIDDEIGSIAHQAKISHTTAARIRLFRQG